MNKILSMAALGLLAFGASAQAARIKIDSPDIIVPLVQCRNTSDLPNGLSVDIEQDGASGTLVANLTNRDGIGPFVNLGEIAVTVQPVPAGVLGAGLTYVGQGFQLHVNTDGIEPNGSHYSSVYADVQGRVFNEPMYCDFPNQTE